MKWRLFPLKKTATIPRSEDRPPLPSKRKVLPSILMGPSNTKGRGRPICLKRRHRRSATSKKRVTFQEDERRNPMEVVDRYWSSARSQDRESLSSSFDESSTLQSGDGILSELIRNGTSSGLCTIDSGSTGSGSSFDSSDSESTYSDSGIWSEELGCHDPVDGCTFSLHQLQREAPFPLASDNKVLQESLAALLQNAASCSEIGSDIPKLESLCLSMDMRLPMQLFNLESASTSDPRLLAAQLSHDTEDLLKRFLWLQKQKETESSPTDLEPQDTAKKSKPDMLTDRMEACSNTVKVEASDVTPAPEKPDNKPRQKQSLAVLRQRAAKKPHLPTPSFECVLDIQKGKTYIRILLCSHDQDKASSTMLIDPVLEQAMVPIYKKESTSKEVTPCQVPIEECQENEDVHQDHDQSYYDWMTSWWYRPALDLPSLYNNIPTVLASLECHTPQVFQSLLDQTLDSLCSSSSGTASNGDDDTEESAQEPAKLLAKKGNHIRHPTEKDHSQENKTPDSKNLTVSDTPQSLIHEELVLATQMLQEVWQANPSVLMVDLPSTCLEEERLYYQPLDDQDSEVHTIMVSSSSHEDDPEQNAPTTNVSSIIWPSHSCLVVPQEDVGTVTELLDTCRSSIIQPLYGFLTSTMERIKESMQIPKEAPTSTSSAFQAPCSLTLDGGTTTGVVAKPEERIPSQVVVEQESPTVVESWWWKQIMTAKVVVVDNHSTTMGSTMGPEESVGTRSSSMEEPQSLLLLRYGRQIVASISSADLSFVQQSPLRYAVPHESIGDTAAVITAAVSHERNVHLP